MVLGLLSPTYFLTYLFYLTVYYTVTIDLSHLRFFECLFENQKFVGTMSNFGVTLLAPNPVHRDSIKICKFIKISCGPAI